MGDKYYNLILALRSQILEYWRETFGRRALGYLEPAAYRKRKTWFLPAETPGQYLTFSRTVVGGGTFSPLTPVQGPEQKKVAMSSSSTVHGGQYDTKYVLYVTLEYLLHAAFVAETIWSVYLKLACISLALHYGQTKVRSPLRVFDVRVCISGEHRTLYCTTIGHHRSPPRFLVSFGNRFHLLEEQSGAFYPDNERWSGFSRTVVGSMAYQVWR